ncbi:MAG: flagellar hook-basal body complex protein [Planctomycetota bacterium]
MNYGLYLSASGVMVNSHRQDVLANNLANVNTAGFKPLFTDVRQRLPESLEDGAVDFGLSNALLDKLGGGILGKDQRVAFTTGAPVKTDRDLDAALTTDNAFFVVQHTDARTGQTDIRLTRAGQFTTNTEGQLVTQGGDLVLSPDNQPIEIEGRSVITRTGELRMLDTQGNLIGRDQIQVASADLESLRPAGKSLFEMRGGDSRELIEQPIVLPGHYESSGTNAIGTMMDIVSATKAATGNARMIQYHDQMLNASINTFARLA